MDVEDSVFIFGVLVRNVLLDTTIEFKVRNMDSQSKFLIFITPDAIFLLAYTICQHNLFVFKNAERLFGGFP